MKDVFGVTCIRPELHCKLVPPEPEPWWSRALSKIWEWCVEIIFPALAFSIWWTCTVMIFR